MALNKIADKIEQAKTDYMEGVFKASEKGKAEIATINNDRDHSSSWMEEQARALVERYETDRAEKAAAVAASLETLYAEGLEAAAGVLSRQPTPGEAAYLQAFMMKHSVTLSDVEQAKKALKGSAVASAAMYERALDKGVKADGGVPGYLFVTEMGERCLNEDKQYLASFGAARKNGMGSVYSFTCDSIQAAMRMKMTANEFTNALRAVAEFE